MRLRPLVATLAEERRARNALGRELAAVRGELRHSEKERRRLEEARAALIAAKGELEARLAAAMQRAQALEEELLRTRGERAAAREQIAALEARIERLERTRAGLREALSTTRATLAQREREMAKLREARERARQRAKRAEERAARLEAEIARVRALVAMEARSLALLPPEETSPTARELQRRLDRQAAKLAALRTRLAERERTLEELRGRLARAEKRVEAVRAQRDALRGLLEQAGIAEPMALVQEQIARSALPLMPEAALEEAILHDTLGAGTILASLPGADRLPFFEGTRIVLPSGLFFEQGRSRFSVEGRAKLTVLAFRLRQALAALPEELPWVLRIDGHTDDLPVTRGRLRNNWELSAARAAAVAEFLIAQGIPAGRLMIAGFADTRPLVPNTDEEGRRFNRRVEIALDLAERPSDAHTEGRW